MNFAKRAFIGLALTATTATLVGAAGWRLHAAVTNADMRVRPPARERTYTVDVDALAKTTIAPIITAYGQIQTWNSLEIRAPSSGPITQISENFRDGLMVEKGELLFRIDPETAGRRVVDAKAALAQAEYELSEAALSLSHGEAEIAAATAETAIRRSDLERKLDLAGKRLTTSTVVNDAKLALSASEQAEMTKRQAVLVAKSRIDKAKASVKRAELTLSDAEKALRETSYRAPFTGRLTDVTATLGRRIAQNEKFAVLIDPAALEVSFQVRSEEFGHLLDPAAPHKLAPLAVKASLELSGRTITVDGRLDRTAAVADTQYGRR
ncbi:MAG: HlyD family efflux transporter periplasmic adaptor subunit, partial [Alphaproteobacteria bacterium]|nr:HlyD family efflux transporter periplasmic adaptor subunit [Alphaproteobacteria bacterium]